MKVGYEGGARVPLNEYNPSSIAEMFEMVRVVTGIAPSDVEVHGYLPEGFPERMPREVSRWIVGRLGNVTEFSAEGRTFALRDSSNQSKAASAAIKESYKEAIANGDLWDEEDLKAVTCHEITRRLFNADLRKEFARACSAPLKVKDGPQGEFSSPDGRYVYEMPPYTKMDRWGNTVHEAFGASMATPEGRVTVDGTFKTLQQAVRALVKEYKGLKTNPKGSVSELLTEVWGSDVVASTKTAHTKKGWRVMIGVMRDPKQAVSTFTNEEGEGLSVFDYEQSVLRDNDVDELVVEQSFEDEPEDCAGDEGYAMLPPIGIRYDSFTDTYYNGIPLMTELANQAGIVTELNNQGLTRNVREEIEALAAWYCKKVWLSPIENSMHERIVRRAFWKFGIMDEEEFVAALRHEFDFIEGSQHQVVKTSIKQNLTIGNATKRKETPKFQKIVQLQSWMQRNERKGLGAAKRLASLKEEARLEEIQAQPSTWVR